MQGVPPTTSLSNSDVEATHSLQDSSPKRKRKRDNEAASDGHVHVPPAEQQQEMKANGKSKQDAAFSSDESDDADGKDAAPQAQGM